MTYFDQHAGFGTLGGTPAPNPPHGNTSNPHILTITCTHFAGVVRFGTVYTVRQVTHGRNVAEVRNVGWPTPSKVRAEPSLCLDQPDRYTLSACSQEGWASPGSFAVLKPPPHPAPTHNVERALLLAVVFEVIRSCTAAPDKWCRRSCRLSSSREQRMEGNKEDGREDT